MGTVGRELEGDGLLVMWHERDCAPRFLFASGDCQAESESERGMILAASSAVALGELSVPTRWATSDDPAGASILMTRVTAKSGTATIVSIYRRAGETLRTRAREASARMQPMVQAFIEMWIEREATASRLRGLTAAIDQNDVGTILVDRQGHVLFSNTAAETLIARKDGLRRTGQMLSATRLADTLRLQAAIEHVVNIDDADRSALPAPVVALQRTAGRPLLAAIAPVDPSAGSSDAAAVVTLYDPGHSMDATLVPVCRMYGLSPVETRLACLLASGMALIDAAAAMRLQEQTARSYMKQLFGKTDTNRQAELVWLLLNSAVRLIPGVKTSFMRPPQMG